jgi:hypothetical protein
LVRSKNKSTLFEKANTNGFLKSLNAGLFLGERIYLIEALKEILELMLDNPIKGFPFGESDDQLLWQYLMSNCKNNEIDIQINELEMDLYYCNLNHKKNSKWPSARIIKYKMYKTLSLNCNDIRFYNCPKIVNAGWHLSYFGDSSFIQNKIKNMAHQEFNNENFTNIDKINKRIENFCDIFDRDNEIHNKVIKISVKDNNRLPYEYERYLNKYYNL